MLPNLFSKPITAASLQVAVAKTAKNPPKARPQAAGCAEGEPPLPMPVLHAVRRIALVGVHHCPLCDRETEINMGQFVESRTGEKDLLRTRCITSADWTKWQALPKDVEWLGVEDRMCPRCLGKMPVDNPQQLRLFA